MNKKIIEKELFLKILSFIQDAKSKAAIYLNIETTKLYWNIGDYLLREIKLKNKITYGKQILVTLSQDLTEQFGKGFTYTALTRMIKVAEIFSFSKIATLSQQLSWSHLIELAYIEDKTKREFYLQMAVENRWSVRNLRKNYDKMLFERTAISKHPQKIIDESLHKLSQNNEVNPDLVFRNTYIAKEIRNMLNY